MLNSLTFHWDFCFVCGDSWQKLFLFSSAKNAGKLLCCSPNFGELPQKDLCGQLAQVLTPSPCVDLVFEKGTQGLCVWIFHQLLFGQVVLEGSPSSIHTLCARQRRQVFLPCCTDSGRVNSLTWWTTSWFRMLFLAQRLRQAMLPSLKTQVPPFWMCLKNVTLVDLMQVLCRGTFSWKGDNYIRLVFSAHHST